MESLSGKGWFGEFFWFFFLNIFLKPFEFKAKKKRYKGEKREKEGLQNLLKMKYSCWAVAKQLLLL